MRKYLSVFSLFIKRNLGKSLLLISAFSAAEALCFIHTLNSDKVLQNEYLSETGKIYLLGIEKIIESTDILILLLGAGFIGITILLCLTGCEFSVKQGYTLRRLEIKEKTVLLCQSLYNATVYGIFFISQALLYYTFCLVYLNFATGNPHIFDGFLSNQTVFLAFYRSDILHALMPIEDIVKHISSLIMIFALGFSTASASYFMRRKKLFIETFILIPVILINFTGSWTEVTYDLIIIGVCLFITGIIITRLSAEVQAYD